MHFDFADAAFWGVSECHFKFLLRRRLRPS